MSRLEQRIRAGGFVVPAELLALASGGLHPRHARAPPYEYRVHRALKEVGAGARFPQLQICFGRGHLGGFMARAVSDGLATQAALIPSICLVRSPSALRFIDENVPGITVPPEFITRV